MFCPKCGKKVSDDKNFCPGCGNDLREVISRAEKEKDENGFNPVPYLVTAVVIVLIISAAFVTINFADSRKGKTDTQTAGDTGSEAEQTAETQQTDLSEVGPPTSDKEVDDMAGEFEETEKYAYDLVNPFYSYAFVETVNNHDSSYAAKFSVENSPVYNALGLEFWQNRPAVSFRRIYDVKVHDVAAAGVYGDKDEDPGNYCVCVSYTYELYNSETGKTSSNIELAIDNVKWETRNGENTLLMYKHTWVNDVPLGTEITAENFINYKN
ncbi:MAG: zinc ribbon domain-containing protein [Clostridiales bacterium]|nr:zinc ribbon domain-containing protein [Clostridiales bacterium]